MAFLVGVQGFGEHEIPNVANFQVDFWEGNKISLLFLRRIRLHFYPGAPERFHHKNLLRQGSIVKKSP